MATLPTALSYVAPLLLALAAACSSAPGASGEFEHTGIQQAVPNPPRPRPFTDLTRPTWVSGAVFSAHPAGGVVAIDSASRSVRTHVLPGQHVQDLAWDPATERLLVAVLLPETDGGRVLALLPTDTGLSVSAESPAFDGELRVVPDSVGTLLINQFEATSWQLLDAALVASGPGRALVTPSGIRPFLGPGGRAWLALDTTGFADGNYQDSLVRVEYGGARFTTEPLSFPAPGRPETRFIRGNGAATWIARKSDAASFIEYASYDFDSPVAPDWQRVEVGVTGPLIDAVVVPTTRSFALLVGGAESHVLYVSQDQHVAQLVLPAPAHPEQLFPRKLAWHDATGLLWVATELGCFALTPMKSGFSQVAHLPETRGPVVVAD
ncbi:MAG TPA: hypothetical protein PKA88_10670 [Polyangiaceae bacterium]|nr:hypothetical protein [Polyangiaceae bacterium]HMR73983.1 hypothetical protein [Polyangiaceae bacterium]